MTGYKNTSPSKKLRSLKRLFSFLQSKVSSNEAKALPKLTTTKQVSVSYIPPAPILNLTKNLPISIPPRRIFHPAVINACQSMFKKHPSQLSPEEVEKFNKYKQYKLQVGDPVEQNVVYLPIGGLRTCLQCGQPT